MYTHMQFVGLPLLSPMQIQVLQLMTARCLDYAIAHQTATATTLQTSNALFSLQHSLVEDEGRGQVISQLCQHLCRFGLQLLHSKLL